MAERSRWVVVVMVAAALAWAGCEKPAEGEKAGEAAKPEEPAKEAEPADPAKAAEPTKKDEPANPAEPAKEDEPAKAAGGGVEVKVKTAVNKATLEKAYKEIYCAQKMGKTDEILDIYKKYGFETPKAWIEAWTETSSDPEWQAQVTKQVQSASCQ